MISALLDSFGGVLMPTHTYKTMLTPSTGPEHNGMTYGSEKDLNRMAEFYHADMPADVMMGVVPEALRQHPKAKRSMHPILSFAGVGVDDALKAQTLKNPLAPIEALAARGGWVLLLGVDHTVNTSLHYAEKLAGRKQFIRWALTDHGVIECPGFPGDSAGFQAIAPDLDFIAKKIQVGAALVQAIPLRMVFSAVVTRLNDNKKDLLCRDVSCKRCNEIRNM